jgi:uncharacterized protein DUF1097
MNALIARALALALVVAVWTAISHLARLPLLLWPVIIGVACFVGSGGGVAGAQKSALSAITGVVWGLLGYVIANGLGRAPIVDALIMGVVVFGMVAQGHVPLLSYAAGTLAAAATTVGTRVGTIEGALQTVVALLIGVGLGFAAEYGAGMVKTRRSK